MFIPSLSKASKNFMEFLSRYIYKNYAVSVIRIVIVISLFLTLLSFCFDLIYCLFFGHTTPSRDFFVCL